MEVMKWSIFFTSIIAGACGSDGVWTCTETQMHFSRKVDECIVNVREVFPIERGEAYKIWDDYMLCQSPSDQRKEIEDEELDQLRICVAWLIDRTCEDVAPTIQEIRVKKKDFPHPPECDPFIERLTQKFKIK